jgi:hypothetical protein
LWMLPFWWLSIREWLNSLWLCGYFYVREVDGFCRDVNPSLSLLCSLALAFKCFLLRLVRVLSSLKNLFFINIFVSFSL